MAIFNHKHRFLKHIFIFFAIVCIFNSAAAQETYTFANPDRALFDGKQLHEQHKFTISQRYINGYIEEVEGKKGQDKKTLADGENVQKAYFLQAANAYELQQTNAASLLRQYIKRFPYSAKIDVCHFMLGNLAFSNRQYNLALQEYNKCHLRRLDKDKKDELQFNKGYAYLKQNDITSAKSEFANLKSNKKSKYQKSALYYYSYCQYVEGNYENALNGFEQVQNEQGLKNVVPYYIVQIYYKKKDYDQLLPYCQKLLAEQPNNSNNAEVYRILGECEFNKGDYANTIKHLTAYEKISKKVVRGDMYMLGYAYFKTNDFANAIKRFSKVTTEQDTLSQNAFLHLGHCYVALNQKDNARMSYASAAKMDADKHLKEEAAYNYTLATYETTTPFGESITAFESFLNEYPSSAHTPEINERLVNIYLTTRDYKAANESLSRLPELSPKMRDAKAYILFQMGVEAFAAKDYKTAISHFEDARRTGTDNFNHAQVLYWQAEAEYNRNNFDKARSCWNAFANAKNAKEYPDFHLTNYNLGYTFFQQDNFKDAGTHFLRYVNNEKDPGCQSYADGLCRLADCYFAQRDLTNAHKYYGRAFDAKGSSSDYAAFQQAYILGLQKNYAGKIKGMNNVISSYPNSTYRDDAFYEMGRAQVLNGQTENAVNTFRALMEKYPNSPLASKAALEIGMAYSNEGKNQEAIAAYKDVVARFPNSIETRTALESLESIYVEENNVSSYFDYTKSLGENIVKTDISREDSLTYLAAERLYMKGDTTSAINAFEAYLKRFCSSSRSANCLAAEYYLADCHYTKGNEQEAYNLYEDLSARQGNPWMEDVLVRQAQLAYDLQDYESALAAFKKLEQSASNAKNRSAAQIGVLRCSYLVDDAQTTIQIGEQMLKEKNLPQDITNETRYYLAKALIQNGNKDKAIPHLEQLAKDTKNEHGAEAKYLVADYLFSSGNSSKAEAEVTDFIKQGTPHQYWLARAFVLLADISLQNGDYFQAKQYLVSLQANYKAQDSIQDLIAERMDIIKQQEEDKVE